MIAPTDSEVQAGNTVLLTCVALGDGSLSPNINWVRGPNILLNDSRVNIYTESLEESGVNFTSSILEICSAELGDAGQYECVVNVAEGNRTLSFQLSVLSEEGGYSHI